MEMINSNSAIDELVAERVNTACPEPIRVEVLAAVLRGERPAQEYRPWLDAFFGRRIGPGEMAQFLERHDIGFQSALTVYRQGVRESVRDARVEAWLAKRAGEA